MQQLLKKIRRTLNDKKNRRQASRVVSSLCCVIVFVTTYAMVLPAITMEQQAQCGIEAHQHYDSCYELQPVCGLEESADHAHTDACYEKVLICGKEAHVHSKACYTDASKEMLEEVFIAARDMEQVSAEEAMGAAGGSSETQTADTPAVASGDAQSAGADSAISGAQGTDPAFSDAQGTDPAFSDVQGTDAAAEGAQGAGGTSGDAQGTSNSGTASPSPEETAEGTNSDPAGNSATGDFDEVAPVQPGQADSATDINGDTGEYASEDKSGEAGATDAADTAEISAPAQDAGAGTDAAAEDTNMTEAQEAAAMFEDMPALIFEDTILIQTATATAKQADAETATDAQTGAENQTDAGTSPARDLLPAETNVTVHVEAEEGTFPAGTSMVLATVQEEALDKVAEAVSNSVEGTSHSFQAVDISFRDASGNEIEPAKPVRVTMTSDAIKTASETPEISEPVVLHMVDEGAAEKIEQTDLMPASDAANSTAADESADFENAQTANENLNVSPDTVSFDSDQFSTYVIVYTVDFHYEVDGKTYDFSLPGGGFVRFADLVEVLGIMGDADNGAKVAGGMLDVAAGDAAKRFAADVASVAFSSPELVDVSRVENETTVGQIKENRGLECQYSADLTDAQIARINAQTLEAGDWVLISMQPFMGEETLTVTMRNGEAFTIRVTDAQISTHVITAQGERFRITVTYEEDAKIPAGAVLAAEEIPEGSEEYEQYLEAAARKWEEEDRDEYINFARFFDIEIRKDGAKIEPEAPVEVEIVHEDGLALFEEEGLSVIHFAEGGTEIIDELHRNEDSTQVVYEQDGFSVIGTVSTVKNSGWPTANGQYVLVLQDGDDYYALKQDGTLEKVRYFNNTVSFIGEGTTTMDYINEYLWYVQSNSGANATGRISDKYYENGTSVNDQMFIAPTQDGWLINSARQIRFNPAEQKLYYTYYNVSRTLSAHNGQLRVVNLNDPEGSPIFFASVSTFTANDNETDLFTQVEVESIIEKWREQKTQEAVYDKTAEVYDYENRVYQVDITASSSDYEVSPSIALEFVVDASRSMFFPTSVTEAGTFSGTNASNVRDWINAHGDTNQVYFVIQDKNGKATQYAIFYDPNSEYTVNEPYYRNGRWYDNYVTHRGQWMWVDASNYNPPDDTANGGTQSSRYEGRSLSSWTYGSLDDGKIYTTGITGSSNGTYGERKTWISRIEYLKQCVRVASQVIYAVDENAQIGLIGFNAATTDYGTFGKSEQETLLNKIDNISLAGGTDHQGGLQKAIDKYQNPSYYAAHYAGRKHVVVLVTDGAPNATGVNWTTIGNVATTLKNLRDDFGHKTELYTMGLSLTNVGSNQSNLFGVSSGAGYTYAGEDAAQIINAVTKMVDGIFVQANLVADVTDVIDPAFYPVNRADGLPLAENDWINLSGAKVNAGANDAAGQIKKDPATGNWYVEWKDQSIDWPTTDANGGITAPGWHGTVFVKAKEDFLGGNGISTNAAGSQIEAKEFIVRGETEQHALPEGDHTTTFDTPFVNVDELDMTKNDTEWTVYLGTNVDPLTEVKALWEKVMVREVVTKTALDHRISPDGRLTYPYASNTSDDRPEANGREEFPITDLEEFTLSDADWEDLLAGRAKIFDYNAYGHAKVGTVMVSLAQAVKTGEKNLSESPHDTEVTGDEVEKYTLTVSYRPVGANISNWHTGSYGSGMSGSRAGNIIKDNTHIINVYVKGLQITKVDLDDRVLPGAKFGLYRSARNDETETLEIDGGQYYKVADLDTSSTGIAVKEQIEQLEEGEQYYLVETQVPAGYNAISPIPVNLSISDTYTPKPGTVTQTIKPDSGIYDWTQNALLVLNAESGVKRTNADNTTDLTHSGVTANSDTETIYYRITNNPGVELPSTGGPGTRLFTILGSIMILGAGVLLWRRRRLI